ncbi:MAG TPA: PH domain-containing protein [Brumimicrobium sp.]|nr:PH domain-containing protein [Brumimicrobium sp.]
MKTDFTLPMRQDFRGILVIFMMDLFKNVKRNGYVFLPLLSSEVRENYLHYILLGLAFLLLLQLLYSYKSYLNFKFYIQGDRFFLRQGVFNFTDTEIPFDRIQNININQNVIHQFLNVVGVDIETAGQNTAEIQIKALSREVAIELKEILLKNGAEIMDEDEAPDPKIASTHKSTPLFKLNFGELLKVGLSSNYVKGFGLVLLFIMTIFRFLEDIILNIYDIELNDDHIIQLYETVGYLFVFFVFILTATFIVTIGRTVFKYFDLKVTKIENDYEVEYGLLKRFNQVIKKSKTQVFEIEENPIKNVFKIKNVFISQASSQELQQKKKIGIVGISDENIGVLFKSLFDLTYPQQFIYSKSSKRLMFRLMIKYVVLSAVIGLTLFAWKGGDLTLLFPVLLLTFFIFLVHKTIQKSHVGVNEDVIEIHSGAIHTNKKYIATHKVQSIKIKRNWFQLRNQHADLIIYTASGSERINYLKYDEVAELVNYLTYKIESSELDWI